MIVTAAVSLIGTGITFMACLFAAYCMAHAVDLPYRQAAGVFTELAAVTSVFGFAGVCGFLVSLRPIARGLAEAARERTEEE
jgi:hypothetical protein